MRALSIACLVAAFASGCAAHDSSSAVDATQAQNANPADVRTVDDIVRASYETISGPAGVASQVRQIARDDTLYVPNARFASVWEENGEVKSKVMTQPEYWKTYDASHAAYESEIGRRIERYGNVAQVRSVAVVREEPDGPVKERYINYYQLYSDGSRWWITDMVWQLEGPGTKIPEAWIGEWEEVAR